MAAIKGQRKTKAKKIQVCDEDREKGTERQGLGRYFISLITEKTRILSASN